MVDGSEETTPSTLAHPYGTVKKGKAVSYLTFLPLSNSLTEDY
jgi:hypothetical protein